MKAALLLLLAASVLLTGCAVAPRNWNENIAPPQSILVVPVANKSLDVDAANAMLTTIPVYLGEKGYYVFPINTTKVILEHEGFYEGERIHAEPVQEIAKLFDADAVLYVTINRWDAQYLVVSTTVTVDLEYRLISKDGKQLWGDRQIAKFTPNNDAGGHPLATLIVAVVNSALARAKPNYLPLAKKANEQAFVKGRNALPNGPLRPSEVAQQ